jgi:hypothetical protein
MIRLIIFTSIFFLLSCSSFSQKQEKNPNLLNRLYVEESGLQFFKFISKDTVLFVSTGDVGYVEPEENYFFFTLKDRVLKIFIIHSDNEKEILICKWNETGDYFLEDEFDLAYRRMKSVVYGTKKYD